MSSGRSAGACAKDRGWPSSSARQRVAAIKRGDPSPRYVGGVERRLTPELLDEIREFIEEEHGRISVTIVSNRFTLSRTSSQKALRCLLLRLLVIRTVHNLEDRHIRDRRKFAEEMLARLALASGRRISRKIATSRRLIWPSFASAMRKSSEFTLRLQVAVFTHFIKQGRRNNATHLFGIHHAKRGGVRGVALLRRPTFEPLFTTHPSEVGSTSPWTLLAAMLRGPLSHPICRQTTTFCGVLSAIQGASAWSSCLLSALAMRCVIAF